MVTGDLFKRSFKSGEVKKKKTEELERVQINLALMGKKKVTRCYVKNCELKSILTKKRE